MRFTSVIFSRWFFEMRLETTGFYNPSEIFLKELINNYLKKMSFEKGVRLGPDEPNRTVIYKPFFRKKQD